MKPTLIFIAWFSALVFGLISVPLHATIVEDLESPVTTDARWILLGGTAATLGVLATHQNGEDPFERSTVAHKPLGTYSKYGDDLGQLLPNAVYAGGMLIAHYSGNSKALSRAWLMVEASLYASAITTVLKYAIQEPRPYDSSVRNSFPSGHATTAFAFAGIVAAEHGWWYGGPAFAMATFVAYSRINDDQHHVHDVVAGATVGLTCAYGIYYAHQPKASTSEQHVQLMPAVIPGGGELVANWSF